VIRILLITILLATVTPSAIARTLVDSGFRPDKHGFSFPNWGGSEHPISALTPDDAAYLFGEQACARIRKGKCVATPGARLWLSEMNKSMEGGHCEGMAALSAAFYREIEEVDDYGANQTSQLTPDDAVLMRTISIYYTTQSLEPVQSVTGATREMSLQQIVDGLVASMASGPDYPTLGIYDTSGGHAVTPYRIDQTGSGKYRIFVYDNNYPGEEKHVDVDTKADRWVYDAAALNPSEAADAWTGGAGTMDYTLLSQRYEPLQCPFCSASDQAAAKAPAAKPRQPRQPQKPSPRAPSRRPAKPANNYTVTTPSPCSDVKAVGRRDGQTVSASRLRPLRGTRGCMVTLPRDQPYDVSINSATAGTTAMTVFSGEKVFQVDNIALQPGVPESISFEGGEFDFHAGSDQQPVIRLADDDAERDGYYEITDIALGGGHVFSADESESGGVAFSDDDPDLERYDIDAELISDDDTQSYTYEDVATGEEGELLFDDADGTLDLDMDTDGDGTADLEVEPDAMSEVAAPEELESEEADLEEAAAEDAVEDTADEEAESEATDASGEEAEAEYQDESEYERT